MAGCRWSNTMELIVLHIYIYDINTLLVDIIHSELMEIIVYSSVKKTMYLANTIRKQRLV